MRWFRIELDDAGRVLSCHAVEAAEQGNRRYVYVEAVDSEHAARLALNAYQRQLMRQRVRRLRDEGKCQCGRKNDRAPKSRCTSCHERRASDDARRRARANGEQIPRPDRRIADALRKATETAQAVAVVAPSLRLDVLVEVQQAWQDASTNGHFTRWLSEQIAAARGRKVA